MFSELQRAVWEKALSQYKDPGLDEIKLTSEEVAVFKTICTPMEGFADLDRFFNTEMPHGMRKPVVVCDEAT